MTGKIISSYDITSIDQIGNIVKNARNAFEKWRKLEILERRDYIRLNQTAHLAAQSRLLNTGQSCIAAKRFIVVKEAAEKYSKLFAQNVESEVVGDPMNSKTTVGH